MNITLNLTWAVFWICIAAMFITAMFLAPKNTAPQKPTAVEICAKNNGVPQYDGWTGKMNGCKIHKN